ncbi:hypothetical protein MJD09_04355, partial [bacterium]|nr:hypothetical protein [bacterium]
MKIHHNSYPFIALVLICVSGRASPEKGGAVSIKNQSSFHRLNHPLTPSNDEEATDLRVCGVSLDLPDLTIPTDWIPLEKRTYVQRPSDEVGDVRTFTAIDFTTTPSDFTEIVARAERKGEHAIIYVDTTETFKDADLDEVLSLFDDRIYSVTTAVFGAEPNPGIDGDPLITILFLPVEESAETVGDVAGYFWSGNQFSQNDVERSNEREMLYIDVARLNRNGATDAGSTIAHEFQHLIHWNHDRDEDRWLNEGLSEYATFVNDFEPSNPFLVFLNNTDFQLTRWTNHPRDYVRSFLWVLYLAEHYGRNSLIRRIVANPANGLSGLMSEVRLNAPALTFEELLSDWFIANYLDNAVDGESPFHYPSVQLPALRPTTVFGFLPIGSRTADVSAQAADYYLFSGGENIVVNLTGPVNESAFKAKILRVGARHSVPEIIDFPLNDFNDGSLPLPDFASDSEQLVLMPYFFDDSSPAISYEFSAGGTGGPSTFADTLQHHDRESQTIIPFGLPSRVVNGEHIDSYAVRFTPSSDGVLVGAGLGVWRRTGSSGTVRMYFYDNVGDSAGVPNLKIDSVDVENVTGTPGNITWNYADFSQKNLPVKAGEHFHLAWEFVDTVPGDTVVAILDTARVPTDRTTVFVREREIWSRFVSRFNLFIRAIVTVPADPT